MEAEALRVEAEAIQKLLLPHPCLYAQVFGIEKKAWFWGKGKVPNTGVGAQGFGRHQTFARKMKLNFANGFSVRI